MRDTSDNPSLHCVPCRFIGDSTHRHVPRSVCVWAGTTHHRVGVSVCVFESIWCVVWTSRRISACVPANEPVCSSRGAFTVHRTLVLLTAPVCVFDSLRVWACEGCRPRMCGATPLTSKAAVKSQAQQAPSGAPSGAPRAPAGRLSLMQPQSVREAKIAVRRQIRRGGAGRQSANPRGFAGVLGCVQTHPARHCAGPRGALSVAKANFNQSSAGTAL